MGPMGLFDEFLYTLYLITAAFCAMSVFHSSAQSYALLVANLLPGTITRSTGPHRLNPNSFLY